MLLHHDDDGVVCIGQAAHSWISGRLARQWVPTPPAAVCLGAEQHDIGMAEWDRRPELNPDTGYPASFLELPLATHLALWTEAPERILSQSPYAAVLVSMHGHELFATKRELTPEIERYLREQERLQADLLERLGADPGEARVHQQLVWAMDHLALVGLIPEWAPEDNPVGDVSLHVEVAGERHVTVDPWPFRDDEIRLAYPGRRLTGTSATEDELHARLATAPWVEVDVRWTRLPRRA
jgi:hypothetical protein